MYAENLDAQLLAALDRPDLRVVGDARRISFDPSLTAAFRADPGGEVVLGAACLGSERVCAFHIRHALELSALLGGARIETGLAEAELSLLAGLCAARTAALFWQLDAPDIADRDSIGAPPASWIEPMAGERVPPAAQLELIWVMVRTLQGSSALRLRAMRPDALCFDRDAGAVVRRLHAIWDLLGPAEVLMARGGDQRLAVDPHSGLNHYGCSHRPRPWAITFASSTASSLSERGFGGAESSRRRIAAAALAGCGAAAALQEARAVRHGIARHYDLAPGCEVVLAASGTDCELLALAVAERAGPISCILTAPEETGTGVPLAAGGMHFADDTSGRQRVRKGTRIAGFRDDTRVVPLAARAADGALRSAAAIEADCAALVEAELQAGRRVLLHLLDLSKTGLLAPSLACLERLQARYPDRVDIVVDACQARLDQRRVRDYLARGWMVMITGSKFFTGPPFCGALLLPVGAARHLVAGGPLPDGALPKGLAAYGSRADWPDGLAAAAHLPGSINLGLVLRWHAALAEMRAFGAVPAEQLLQRLEGFLAGVRGAIGSHARLRLVEVPVPERRLRSEGGLSVGRSWDQLQTILSFLVLDEIGDSGDRAPLTLERARLLYRWLNADVSAILPADARDEDRTLARQLCHIGQPAPVPHPALDNRPAGALRISAGARLLSGEPSHGGLDVERRLARELADVGRVLDKITLLLEHWDALQAADPEPSYAPRS